MSKPNFHFYRFLHLSTSRQEIKTLRDGTTFDKEHLTTQWITKSMKELRTELAEVQESVSSGSKDAQLRSQIIEDVDTMQSEYKKIKLELDALRSRQEKTEVLMRDLRDELMQSSEDIRKSFILNEQVTFQKSTKKPIRPFQSNLDLILCVSLKFLKSRCFGCARKPACRVYNQRYDDDFFYIVDRFLFLFYRSIFIHQTMNTQKKPHNVFQDI